MKNITKISSNIAYGFAVLGAIFSMGIASSARAEVGPIATPPAFDVAEAPAPNTVIAPVAVPSCDDCVNTGDINQGPVLHGITPAGQPEIELVPVVVAPVEPVCDDCTPPVLGNQNPDIHGITPAGQPEIELVPVVVQPPVVVPPTVPVVETPVVTKKERKVRRSSGGMYIVKQDAPTVATSAPTSPAPKQVVVAPAPAPKQNKTVTVAPKENKVAVVDTTVAPKDNNSSDIASKQGVNDSNVPATASAVESFGDKFVKFFSGMWNGFLNLFN